MPIGRPHPGVTFHLVDEDGAHRRGSPNRVGELYIGGEQLMDGYWGAPVADRGGPAYRRRARARPSYRTGDLVYRDENGDYVYVDRADRVIKRSGVRISLVELSEAMRRLTGVSAAACVTFDNEGELGIVAFVVTDAADVCRSSCGGGPGAASRDDAAQPDRTGRGAAAHQVEQARRERLLSEAGLQPPRSARPETGNQERTAT